MKEISTKEFPGGEVGLTKFISENYMVELMNLLGLSEEGVKHVPERRNLKGARPDIVSEKEGKVVLVTECQDASGKLDGAHLNKIYGYMIRSHCTEGVLLCEETPEDLRQEVVSINSDDCNSTSVHIVTYTLYENGFINFSLNCSPEQSVRSNKYENSGSSNSSFALSNLQKRNFEVTLEEYKKTMGDLKIKSRCGDNPSVWVNASVEIGGAEMTIATNANKDSWTTKFYKRGSRKDEVLSDKLEVLMISFAEEYNYSLAFKGQIPGVVSKTKEDLIQVIRDIRAFYNKEKNNE